MSPEAKKNPSVSNHNAQFTFLDTHMGAMLIKCVLVLQKEQAERSQTKPLEEQHVGFIHISGRIYFFSRAVFRSLR